MANIINKVERTENKGYFLVSFTDGYNDIAFYDKSLDYVVTMLARQTPKREVKSIAWVEE